MGDDGDSVRLVALLALTVVPWTILGDGSLVFPWGLAIVDSLHVTTVWDYVFVYTAGLPRRLLAWPIGSLLYLLAVLSAGVGVLVGEGYEDRRLTGGLLALAGANHLLFAVGMANRSRLTVIPLGVVLLWGAAWWFHWPDIRRIV
ncbi:TIGR04206 family protein [Halorussus halophilus]|uniref:TIGR04206 family protein n=1 Tax=Halorussus halophilus TaxID=2650975 RepID=UPI00130195A6|nr:TIGR04206 family protein [Halorussus halophilus]